MRKKVVLETSEPDEPGLIEFMERSLVERRFSAASHPFDLYEYCGEETVLTDMIHEFWGPNAAESYELEDA